jgi:L-ribulokinase
MSTKYVIGLDFGTDSVRALLVNATTGEELYTAIQYYPRWAKGLYCNADLSQFRQHPLDYLEGMEQSIVKMLSGCTPETVANIIGISIDTTGSTPVAVDREGTPLALLPEFAENPNAMFILWKDHTAHAEADEINALASTWSTDFTKYSGGIYSPEWFWSKIVHVLRENDQVAAKAYSWMEHCDWMPALLCGVTDVHEVKRSRCAAGHKAMWHEDFGGLPSEEYLVQLEPRLKGIREKLYTDTYTSDIAAGVLSKEWAQRLGLPETVKVGVGGIDAHFGAVGAAIEPYTLVKVMGTSTCDMLIAPLENHSKQLVKGICGQVDGSILPGMLGMEAGQSAFGDLYKWFEVLLSYPLVELLSDKLSAEEIEAIKNGILPRLNAQAAVLPVTEQDEVALDWINGRRTPDVDLSLTGAITGLRLASTAPRLFKTLVEATAYGSKAIMERFISEGIPVNKVIVLGGISKKSSFVLQTLANILEVPIEVVRSEQACAMGAAMFAATIGGLYPDIQEAQKAMTSGFDAVFTPQPEKVAVYQKLYEKYKKIGAIL